MKTRPSRLRRDRGLHVEALETRNLLAFVLLDGFDDTALNDNSTGIGSGFHRYINNATAIEAESQARLAGGTTGGHRAQIGSMDTFATYNDAITATFSIADFGRDTTENNHTARAFVGLAESSATDGQGVANRSVLSDGIDGLWVGLQFRDNVGGIETQLKDGDGNGKGGLFHVNDGEVTLLEEWTWDQSLVQWDAASLIRSDRIQMDLIDDLNLVLSSDSNGYSLSFSTSGNGNLPANVSGTWADAGVPYELGDVHAAAHLQGDVGASLALESVTVETEPLPLEFTADNAVQVVLFVPNGSRSDRGQIMWDATSEVQEQWQSWGWTFNLEDHFYVVNAPLAANAYEDGFSDIADVVRDDLRARGRFNEDATYVVFAEDSQRSGVWASAINDMTIQYGAIVDRIADGENFGRGVIGHELGHTVGIQHENCNGTQFDNFPTQTRGPMCSSLGWPDALAPTDFQYDIAEHVGWDILAEYDGGYELPITYISDLMWESTTYAPADIRRDLSVGGNTLKLNNNPWARGFTKGLGVRASGEVVYRLDGEYTRFQTNTGIDDEIGDNGVAIFQVWGDGQLLYDPTTIRTGSGNHEYIDIDVTGIDELRLETTGGRGDASLHHANWAGARLIGTEYPKIGLADATGTVPIPTGHRDPNAADGTDFGSVTFGSASVQRDYVITNTGTATMTLGGADLPPGFEVANLPVVLAPGETGTVRLEMTTEVPGVREGIVGLITNGEGDEKLYEFEVRGEVQLAGASTTFVSDFVDITDAPNGWGPMELNQSVGGTGANDGDRISVDGRRYDKGIGMHSSKFGEPITELVVSLGGQYDWFLSDIGVDDSVDNRGDGSVEFWVQVDSGSFIRSRTLFSNSHYESFAIPVTGAQTLTLQVHAIVNGARFDHADWAAARLITMPDPLPNLPCDFVGNGNGCDIDDIDALYAGTNGSPAPLSDALIAGWLADASVAANPLKPTTSTVFVSGDVNLDGAVDSTDLGLLLNSFGSTGGLGWGSGNLNADALVDSTDLGVLLNNFGFNSPVPAAATSAFTRSPTTLVAAKLSPATETHQLTRYSLTDLVFGEEENERKRFRRLGG